MHRPSFVLVTALLLAACVDTTGLSAESSNPPHPKSNPNAAVVVAEYADLQCPACKGAHVGIVQPLVEKLGSQIRYEFHHFPLSSIHRNALVAAQGAECASDQSKFWDFIDIAYERQEELSRTALTEWATELKLDADLFDRCVDSGIKRDAVLAEYRDGQSKNVAGTPTFFVNGQAIQMNGDASSVEKAVQAALDAMKAKL